jgi:replicative DNA helicase
MSEPKYVTGADAMASWRDELLSGTPPVLYPVGDAVFSSVQIGPRLVTLIGGAPGAGKTALAMQFVLDALLLSPSLRAAVCNVEMPPGELLNRQLARMAGVELTAIRHRQLTEEHGERIDAALAALEPLAERLCFVRPPFTLDNVAATADAFDADLLVLDYVQRIAPPGEHRDNRGSLNALMSYLRQFADAGVGILAVAAVGRSKDAKGRSSYNANDLSLASFKESGELEYGADSAYLLCPDGDGETVTLRCLKDRYGEPRDIGLHFDRPYQRFAASTDGVAGHASKAAKRKLQTALAALWDQTDAAGDGGEYE